MAKVFFSYQQQIEKLVKEKDLLIADEEYAKEMLKRYSYYSLISGYKDIFKNTKISQLSDQKESYNITSKHDKIFRTILDKKEEAVTLINQSIKTKLKA